MNNWAENQVTKMPSTGVPGIKRRLAALIYRALALPFAVLDLAANAYASQLSSIAPHTNLMNDLQVEKFQRQIGSDESIAIRLQERIAQDETSIRWRGDFKTHEYARLLQRAMENALALETKLPGWIRSMDSMSGRKYRGLINTLVEGMPTPRYLEVGSWAGSTACSAISGNRMTACCIDNWSEFNGPNDTFQRHIKRVVTPAVNFRFIEADFRSVDFAALGKFNIYCFDGPHSERDHIDGVSIAQPALDDEYLLIIDDWNWKQVRDGTMKALESLRVKIIAQIQIHTTQDNSHPTVLRRQFSDWHNGYFIAVCRKSSQHVETVTVSTLKSK